MNPKTLIAIILIGLVGGFALLLADKRGIGRASAS